VHILLAQAYSARHVLQRQAGGARMRRGRCIRRGRAAGCWCSKQRTRKQRRAAAAVTKTHRQTDRRTQRRRLVTPIGHVHSAPAPKIESRFVNTMTRPLRRAAQLSIYASTFMNIFIHYVMLEQFENTLQLLCRFLATCGEQR